MDDVDLLIEWWIPLKDGVYKCGAPAGLKNCHTEEPVTNPTHKIRRYINGTDTSTRTICPGICADR